MKKTFRKAWVNANNADQISVQFQTVQEGVAPSASLAAQGFDGTDTRTVIQSFKRSVFEKTFPGYTPGATAESAVVVNMDFPKFAGSDWKIQHLFTTDSTKARSEYFTEVRNSTTKAVMTSDGAVVYRKAVFTLDVDAKDDVKPTYDRVATPAVENTPVEA